jgi:hypothetical protein
MIETDKIKFLEDEIWGLSFNGAFQRAKVYKKGRTNKEKAVFRKAIRKEIRLILEREGYDVKTPSSEGHIKILEEIKESIDGKFQKILDKGSINLGVVQKLVNLHLKYRWCLGWVKTPPHSPFDRVILTKLKFKDTPSWVRMNDMKEYRDWIKRAADEAKAGGYENIAGWELGEFRRPGSSGEK